jgi:hypothetical protein
MVDFTISNEKTQVSLLWSTENEVNTSQFIIERSNDGKSFESIGTVTAANKTGTNKYSFIDKSPLLKTSYYRLQQLDKDGKFTYSKIVSVNRNEIKEVTILPNPATQYFSLNTATNEKLNVQIFSVAGKLIKSGKYSSGEQISVADFTNGMYVVMINNKAYKLIKQ